MSASQRGKNPRILSNTIFCLSVTKDVFPLFSFRQAGKILTELACKTRAMPSELLGRVSLWTTSLSRNTCKLRGKKNPQTCPILGIWFVSGIVLLHSVAENSKISRLKS